MINEWNVDLLLHIVQYLNAADMAKLSLQSRRWYYIVHQYRLNPRAQCVSVASYQPVRGSRQGTHYSPTEMYNRAISDLQGPPQLLLSFSTNESSMHQEPIHSAVRRCGPSNMVLLDCVADKIQTAGIQHRREQSQRKPESKSQVAWTMLSGLPSNVKIQPFWLKGTNYSLWDTDTYEYVDQHFDTALDWKVVILYVAGDFDILAQTFIRRIQAKFPQALVVGGVCSAASVSFFTQKQVHCPSVEYMVRKYSEYHLRDLNDRIGGDDIPDTVASHEQVAAHVYNEIQRKQYEIVEIDSSQYHAGGICGVALAGDVPVRCVVSRGVARSLLAQYVCGTPTTSFSIHEAKFRDDIVESDEEDNVSPYHLVRAVREESTGRVIRGSDLMFMLQISDFAGTQGPNEDGFLLENLFRRRNFGDSSFGVSRRADGRNLVGASVDFFSYTGKQSVADMEFCMSELRKEITDDEVLGALMFTCNGRGPSPKRTFIPKGMSDAKCWARHFPNIPCTGFYALGEFGPSPRAGRQSIVDDENYSEKLQLTAVVLLFIVPSANAETIRTIDDTEEAIFEFVQKQLKNDKVPSRPAKRQHRENS
jgi:small ligand-binding sensory domain FIST